MPNLTSINPSRLTIAESYQQQQAAKPARTEQSATKPKTELHPWLKNTFIGGAIGTVAGTGTALAVSSFLDDPLIALNRAKVGGLQGVVSGTAGAVVAQWAPDRTSGTIVGALVGAGTGLAQAWGTSGSNKVMLISGALTGLVAGATAGHVSVTLRTQTQAAKAIEAASLGH